MSEPELISIESIRRLDVKPGGTLVVTMPEPLSAQEFERATTHLKDLLPEGIKIIVTTHNVDFSVIAGGNDG